MTEREQQDIYRRMVAQVVSHRSRWIAPEKTNPAADSPDHAEEIEIWCERFRDWTNHICEEMEKKLL
ncbi:hypothetical protein ACFQWB_03885 [Paenibacillus thermoaerophilus]|uniref:Uncharacterized protein n=1 Tax=Paenibacillus thermoaerophilus TaxID=1215385 RepID=A0ABW2V3B9_9BACL|nr:hypothetical protein [Paenibacillus thermoaerophilus]TMV16027.1 hypothetical protein FE781_09395 [Paenibacillus thermoaerophilus]